MRNPEPDDNGVERQFPRDAGDSWLFKVKDGVERVRFGDPGWRLGYARDAVNSYFVFKTLREKGVLRDSTCASRCRSPIGQQRAAAAHFPEPGRPRQGPAGLHGGAAR